MQRLGEDEFQIVTKLLACQISGTWGEGLGKLLMRVLFTQGYSRKKMPFNMLGLSVYFFHQQTSWLWIYYHDKDALLLTTFMNYTWREDEREKRNNSLLLLTPNKIPGNAEFFILYFGSVDNSAQHNAAKWWSFYRWFHLVESFEF